MWPSSKQKAGGREIAWLVERQPDGPNRLRVSGGGFEGASPVAISRDARRVYSRSPFPGVCACDDSSAFAVLVAVPSTHRSVLSANGNISIVQVAVVNVREPDCMQRLCA